MPVNPRPVSAGQGGPNQKTLEFVTFEGLPASGHTGGAPPFSGQFQSPLFGILFGGSVGPGWAFSGRPSGWLLGSAGDLKDGVSTSAGGHFESSWGYREYVWMLSWCPLPVFFLFPRTIVSAATCIGARVLVGAAPSFEAH